MFPFNYRVVFSADHIGYLNTKQQWSWDIYTCFTFFSTSQFQSKQKSSLANSEDEKKNIRATPDKIMPSIAFNLKLMPCYGVLVSKFPVRDNKCLLENDD